MKNFLVIFFCFIPVWVMAQRSVAKPEQIDAFLKTTTFVVYDDDFFNTYNGAIKDAIDKNWTITPFQYCNMQEFEQKRKNPKYSFLIRTQISFKKDDDDNTEYSFLSLLLGGDYVSVNTMPELCSFPLSYLNVDYEKYDYKLPVVVRFMQEHINITKNNPKLNERNIISYYNRNMYSTKDKTLYLLKEELAPEVNTIEKIKKVYNGKIKLVTQEELKEVIDNKNPDVVFLHKVGPPEDAEKKARCFKTIMSASDAKLYYFDYHKIKGKNVDAFLESDFKSLNYKKEDKEFNYDKEENKK